MDYSVDEYLLGDGTTTISVAYDRMGEVRSYDLYVREHTTGQFGTNPLLSQEEYGSSLKQIVWDAEASMADIIEGHKSVVFLALLGAHNAIAIEAWQVVAQWDLQIDDNSVVQAVRYGSSPDDPEHAQPLTELRTRITDAAATEYPEVFPAIMG